MIHRWKYSLKRGYKGYLYSTSIAVGVIISKCKKWDLFMFVRSVDIRGHCSNVLTVNWSIIDTLIQMFCFGLFVSFHFCIFQHRSLIESNIQTRYIYIINKL